MQIKLIITNCLAGLYSLLADPAGTLCLIALATVGLLAVLHRVSDIAVASCFSALPLVVGMLKHKSFSGSDIDKPIPNIPIPPPDRGQI